MYWNGRMMMSITYEKKYKLRLIEKVIQANRNKFVTMRQRIKWPERNVKS